jgi:hypothetical protein
VRELEAGVAQTPEVIIADAGYWNEQHMDDVPADHGIQVLIPPDSGDTRREQPGWTGERYAWMLASRARHSARRIALPQRHPTIEPVFAHTKHNRKFDRFHRRGRRVLTNGGK